MVVDMTDYFEVIEFLGSQFTELNGYDFIKIFSRIVRMRGN